jgi:protein-S-isoprenylcysteine O-methyltransferase Ste14
MTLGLALYRRSISILLFSVVLFLGMHGIVVPWEEPFLEKRYGESYLQYKHSVNRWLPTFRPRAHPPLLILMRTSFGSTRGSRT